MAFQNLLQTLLDGPLTISASTVDVTNDIVRGEAINITNASAVIANRKKTVFEIVKVTVVNNEVTFLKRGLTKADSEIEDAGLKKEWKKGDYLYITMLASDIISKDGDNVWNGVNDFSGYTSIFGNTIHTGYANFVGASNPGVLFPRLTTVQRTALTPLGPCIVYDTDDGEYYKRQGGAWITIATGTFPRASETVEGKVRVQTATEFSNKTDTGSDGATLVMKPSNVDEAINTYSESYGGSLIDDSFMLGEIVTAGQCVFLESGPATGVATNKQNIGDVAGNTRVSFPVIGTGEASDTFKVNICKTGSTHPAGQGLYFRIETDNAGSPSGTLIDTNAIAHILPADLTTSLADTIMTFAGGSGTDGHGVTLDSTEASQTVYKGVKITLTSQTGIVSVDKDSDCTATKAYIYDLTGVLLTEASFVGDVATFNYTGLVNGQSYYLLVGSDGSAYTSVKQTGSASYPYSEDRFDFVEGAVRNLGATDTATQILTGMISGLVTNYFLHFEMTKTCLLGSASFAGGNLELYDYLTNTLLETATGGTFSGNTILTNGTRYYIKGTLGESRQGNTTQSYPQVRTNMTMLGVSIDNGGGVSGIGGTITTLPYTVADANINNIVDINYGGQITIPLGQKCHLVAFQSTSDDYADTVIDTDYYNIGYSTNNTTTRPLNTYETSRGTADNDIFPYISSDLFQDKLLSLTDSDYAYKVDLKGIAIESKGIGTYPKLTIQGINGEQSGLTMGTDYYLGATPGSISATPGTYPIIAGKSISSTKINKFVDSRVIISGTSYQVCDLTSTKIVTNIGLPYVLYKSCQITVSGIYKVTFALNSPSNFDLYGKIYVNGAAIGTERVVQSTSGSWDEDIKVNAGDVIGIYCYKGSVNPNPGQLTKLQVRYNIRNLLPITASTVD